MPVSHVVLSREREGALQEDPRTLFLAAEPNPALARLPAGRYRDAAVASKRDAAGRLLPCPILLLYVHVQYSLAMW